ncbi:DNA-binding transcriptional regulator, AcrR family [Asanoa hainanensis]|uniref:DNA-binding transcriptional regulator, AcrR family n=1 Tax=Asanoa hainanensis TaxID=560556 RepID=A0A239JXD1_9ACTN|nr:TetR/AcrR family transcriptional regulator [Asanoa hainanensis]SNT10420.1 DNA-binding transcriptional regulator, AcrR family [Asanoa hainanensis]
MADPRQPDEVRDRVLATARQLFNHQGINATGVDLLSERAGVSKRTLYQRFRTKDDLIAAYLTQETECFLEDLLPPDDSGKPPAERIVSVFSAVREKSQDPDFQGCPVLNTTAEIRDPAHPARVVGLTYKQCLQQFFADEARAADATDPDQLSEQLVMLFDGAMSYSAVRGTPIPHSIEVAVRTLVDAAIPPA